MWSSLLTNTLSFFTTLTDFTIGLVAILLLVGAIAFYVYSLIDIRVPKLIVGPVIGILIFPSGYIFATQNTQTYERKQCEIKALDQQQKLDKLTLEAAIQIRDAKQQNEEDLAALKVEQSQQSNDLNAEITRLKQESSPSDAIVSATTTTIDGPILPIDPNADPNTPVPSPKPVVITNSCLGAFVPPSLMRIINGNATGAKGVPASK